MDRRCGMESNLRYGVVNLEVRERYEKDFQLSYGYDFITRNKREAIEYCKSLKMNEYVVEKIYDDFKSNNNKEVIFKGGEYEKNY